MRTRLLTALATLASLPAGLSAQSYKDLTTVRARPWAYTQVVQVRAGVLGGLAGDTNEAVGLEDEIGWDGHLFWHQEQAGGREAALDAYAGRDGAYFSLMEGTLLGGDTQTRLEATMRYFPFYREGFYQSGDFIPTGRYEGFDWGVGLMFARQADEGLRIEFGPFFRRNSFEANEDTAANFIIPDDFNAYGARFILEHNTLILDRVTNRPRQGFIFTVIAEREQNDSDRRFGTQGIYETTLPSGFWRGFAHLEWFFPQSQEGTWTLHIDGQLTDEQDRVFNYDAYKPQGSLWVDAEIGFRLDFGQAFSVRPFAKGQYVQVLDQFGVDTDDETFFGGGLETRLDFGDNLSLLADYSYLSNESRAPISTSADTFGEHRFFVGVEARFGAQRR